ncbi:hypothetical protein [Thiothrix lacustris]|uniref:Uncharacterized protein n=1 Tax=Thiothrix lacustris TaxID=525917 RepID=A0ABY9MT00_9GAMM|nr:hypothetical protein [Thiothrix lacustris]WML91567.1 hypothetical protein RCF98_04285 [Thiothrix lacustris]WMP16590.1 hypothetical protein RCS87_14535 [Thiothrix lacustris]
MTEKTKRVVKSPSATTPPKRGGKAPSAATPPKRVVKSPKQLTKPLSAKAKPKPRQPRKQQARVDEVMLLSKTLSYLGRYLLIVLVSAAVVGLAYLFMDVFNG